MSGEPARSSIPVVVVATLFAVFVAVNSLAAFDWDATVFVGFGEEATATRDYAEAILGPVELRRAQGHDGKFFFVQAIDPWVLDPSRSAELLEPPVYRAQRLLYPLVAGLGGLLPPAAIVWGLLGVNILGLAVGTWASSRLALLLGGSRWWGLAFALNVGLVFDLQNDGAGIVAACLGMLAVLLLYEARSMGAVALLTAAVLTREVMLVTVVGVALWHWFEGRKRLASITMVFPCLAFGLWFAYLTARLGPDEINVGAFGAPFAGIAEAVPGWLTGSVTMVAALATIVILILYAFRWWKSRTVLGWAFVGFVPLAFLLSDRVWSQIFDFTRALAPVLTAALLLIFVEWPNREREATREGSGHVSGE